MDLSKIPDLALRQKIKPINDAIEAIEEKIRSLRNEHQEKLNAALAPLRDESDQLESQLADLLGERDVVATCDATGLPIFDDNETVEKHVLACVAEAA